MNQITAAAVPFVALVSVLALVVVAHPDPAVRGRAQRVLEALLGLGPNR